MAKTKSQKWHKIKIHHNRWLIWAIAYLLFVAIALVGYIKFFEITYPTEIAADSTFQPWRAYKSQSLGFSLRYPSTWSLESNSASSVNFIPSENNDSGVSVTALNAGSDNLVRKNLNIVSEKSIVVDSVPGMKIVNNIGKGSKETVVLVTHNHKLYVMRGSDSLVSKLLLTIHFL